MKEQKDNPIQEETVEIRNIEKKRQEEVLFSEELPYIYKDAETEIVGITREKTSVESVLDKYKERLVDISVKNKLLVYKGITNTKQGYDLATIPNKDFNLREWLVARGSGSITIDKNSFIPSLTENVTQDEALLLNDKAENIFINTKKSMTSIIKEVTDYEKETGKNTLYIGYPFIEGAFDDGTHYRAPLFLLPVTVNVSLRQVKITHLTDNPVMLNRVLLLAFTKYSGLDIQIDDYELEDLKDLDTSSIGSIMLFLSRLGIPSRYQNTGLLPIKKYLKKDSDFKRGVNTIRDYCVLGSFDLATSIYSDYEKLESRDLGKGIEVLLGMNKVEPFNVLSDPHINTEVPYRENDLALITDLDSSQELAVFRTTKSNNLVVYGPPGTGKSQVIANIISNAIMRGKKVLMVSQKKSALDVVYNRLGELNTNAILLTNSSKGKKGFYDSVRVTFADLLDSLVNKVSTKTNINQLSHGIEDSLSQLSTIHSVLSNETRTGLSLSEMYKISKVIDSEDTENYNYLMSFVNSSETTVIKESDYKGIKESVKKVSDEDIILAFLSLKENTLKFSFLDYFKDKPTFTIFNIRDTLKGVEVSTKTIDSLSSKLKSRYNFDYTESETLRDKLKFDVESIIEEQVELNYGDNIRELNRLSVKTFTRKKGVETSIISKIISDVESTLGYAYNYDIIECSLYPILSDALKEPKGLDTSAYSEGVSSFIHEKTDKLTSELGYVNNSINLLKNTQISEALDSKDSLLVSLLEEVREKVGYNYKKGIEDNKLYSCVESNYDKSTKTFDQAELKDSVICKMRELNEDLIKRLMFLEEELKKLEDYNVLELLDLTDIEIVRDVLLSTEKEFTGGYDKTLVNQHFYSNLTRFISDTDLSLNKEDLEKFLKEQVDKNNKPLLSEIDRLLCLTVEIKDYDLEKPSYKPNKAIEELINSLTAKLGYGYESNIRDNELYSLILDTYNTTIKTLDRGKLANIISDKVSQEFSHFQKDLDDLNVKLQVLKSFEADKTKVHSDSLLEELVRQTELDLGYSLNTSAEESEFYEGVLASYSSVLGSFNANKIADLVDSTIKKNHNNLLLEIEELDKFKLKNLFYGSKVKQEQEDKKLELDKYKRLYNDECNGIINIINKNKEFLKVLDKNLYSLEHTLKDKVKNIDNEIEKYKKSYMNLCVTLADKIDKNNTFNSLFIEARHSLYNELHSELKEKQDELENLHNTSLQEYLKAYDIFITNHKFLNSFKSKIDIKIKQLTSEFDTKKSELSTIEAEYIRESQVLAEDFNLNILFKDLYEDDKFDCISNLTQEKKNIEKDIGITVQKYRDSFESLLNSYESNMKFEEVFHSTLQGYVSEGKSKLSVDIMSLKDVFHLLSDEINLYDEKRQKLLEFTEVDFVNSLDNLISHDHTLVTDLIELLKNPTELLRSIRLVGSLSDIDKAILTYCYNSNSTSVEGVQALLTFVPNLYLVYHIELLEVVEASNLELINKYDALAEMIVQSKSDKVSQITTSIKRKITKNLNQLLSGDTSNITEFARQLKKSRNLSPVRKFVETYWDLLNTLFPIWLVTPDVSSQVLPLQEDLFDMVIFDEASQMFVETALPSLYRGKSIVIAGDDKQLKPSNVFSGRFDSVGDEADDEVEDLTAALEEKSLLDLAKVNYDSVNLTYHYRSKYAELINFSNYAFYNGRLKLAPNVIKQGKGVAPIERILVDGVWEKSKNDIEAEKVVDLIYALLKERKNNETIGIVTFNSTQQDAIQNKIDARVTKDSAFATLMTSECNRVENNEDVSLFVKNIENVQGDERDIIIFSTGYAPDSKGTLRANFGSLSQEGGENRLNVAVSRAKQKIYVITSFEPEMLKTDTSKNLGPKLLKTYLQYVRAVSNGNSKLADEILLTLNPLGLNLSEIAQFDSPFEEDVFNALVEQGYEVETQVGVMGYRIDLAVYDRVKGVYIAGIECDGATYHSSKSARERDINRQRFLESRGWKILRIWSRNWWKNSKAEVQRIVSELESIRLSTETTAIDLQSLQAQNTSFIDKTEFLSSFEDVSLKEMEKLSDSTLDNPQDIVTIKKDVSKLSPLTYFDNENCKGKKPSSITIQGKEYSVKTWTDVLITSLNHCIMIGVSEEDLLTLGISKTNSRSWVRKEKTEFTKARELYLEGYYTEINLNSGDKLNRTIRLLETFSINPSEVYIELL